jgi:DNA-binding IclR family transcriptional regulator
MKEGQKNGRIQSDEKLFAIIDALYELDRAGVTELSQFLEMPKSTVHKHLKSLQSNDYVVNDEGEYRLSFLFLKFGGAVRHSNRMCTQAIDTVQELATQTDKLATFAIREQDRGIITYYYNDKYDVDAAYVGKMFVLHQNAAGKAILSAMSDEEIDRVVEETGLPPATENTIQDRGTLLAEIETIRDEGFASSVEERQRGVQSISAVVKNDDRGDIGALSLSGPVIGRNKSQTKEEYVEIVVDLARELELKLL